MNSTPRVKLGKLVGYNGHLQHIVTDQGEDFYLAPGWDAAAGAKVGDRIRLEYRATPRLALWYGSVVTP